MNIAGASSFPSLPPFVLGSLGATLLSISSFHGGLSVSVSRGNVVSSRFPLSPSPTRVNRPTTRDFFHSLPPPSVLNILRSSFLPPSSLLPACRVPDRVGTRGRSANSKSRSESGRRSIGGGGEGGGGFRWEIIAGKLVELRRRERVELNPGYHHGGAGRSSARQIRIARTDLITLNPPDYECPEDPREKEFASKFVERSSII